jgi:WD40 repeat protein/energy-coupling factor transporter ATP-binding protein EcfA2
LGEQARADFADRFTRLYAEAGNPPLKQVVASVAAVNAVDERGRIVRVSGQRISDWRNGQNVPARFSALAAVLRILVGEARKRRPAAAVEGLYDLNAWQSLWCEALSKPADQRSAALHVVQGTSARSTRVDVAGTCPYRGLAMFRQEDAGWFFGREAATEALLDRLAAALDGGGLVMLIGASGAGKSSLLRAGLIPSIRKGELPAAGSKSWPIVCITPGEDPLRELATQIQPLAAALTEATDLDQGEKSPVEWLGPGGDHAGTFQARVHAAISSYAEAEAGPGARVILVVDQLEELFTLCQNHWARRVFIEALRTAATPSSLATSTTALVVLGIRADFYRQCLDYPALAEALQDRQMLLGPMTVPQLRDAITGPAKAAGLRVDPGLVELLHQDAGLRAGRSHAEESGTYEAGVLPLLSHALRATWQHRRAARLTVAGYRAAGGIHGAVEATAERAWAGLDPAGQTAALGVLLALTRIAEDTQDTRRRSTKQRLLEQAANRAAAERALEVLTRTRLVSMDAECVQITHEAVLRAWPRLRRWIDRNREGLLLAQALEEDALRWDDQDRDPHLLYRGARLETIRKRLAEREDISELAKRFLAASIRARRRRTWGLRAGVALVMVSGLVAGIFAVVASNQRDDARFADVVAQADRLIATDPSLAAQLDLIAHRMRPADREVIGRLLSTQNAPLARALPAPNGAIYDTSFSPDGHTLATASYGHTVQLWNLTDKPTPLASLDAGASWVSAARFSPDGHTLAASNGDGTVHLWNVTDPAHPQPLPTLNGHNGSISLLAFSPGGHILATANDDHTVRLWNLTVPTHPAAEGEPLTGHTGIVRTVAFSPDGHLLAAGSDDNTAHLWDLTSPAHPIRIQTSLTGHAEPVHSVAFSPDGRLLATGSDDKSARLWNLTDPNHPTPIGLPLTGHQGPLWSVAFSPDGQTLATASEDGTARLWNVTNPERATPIGERLATRIGGVLAAAFTPDGRTLVTGGEDGTTLLWSLPATVLVGHRSLVEQVAFSPDRRVLATGGKDRTVRLWDVSKLTQPTPLGSALSGHIGAIYGVAFSSDGRLLASGSADHTVRLWNVADPHHPTPIGRPIDQHNQYADPVAFSPDGRTLATTDTDKTVQFLDITNPGDPAPLGTALTDHQGYVNSIVFGDHGRLLVTASSDGTVRLWDMTNPARPTSIGVPLDPHAGQVYQAVLSPDGRILAATGEDKQVWLWDVTDRAHPLQLGSLTGHSAIVVSVAFSPDGHTLASGSVDRTARLWDLTDPYHPAPVGEPLAGHTSEVKAVVFAPAGNSLATASWDGTAMIWDLNLDHAIQRICTTTQGSLTPTDWHRYLPELPYSPPPC